MSYEVLARKLRPMGFDTLVGQEHVVRALRHALDADRLHHAYLFTGTRGVGKTTIARILAKALNCEEGVSSTPCGVCSVCTEVRENRFVDLIEVDAASRTGVDDTRDLLENAQYLPTRGRYKVYLIDEVHMLSTASFNALLKTLEEPPEHVKFLLATTDPKKVPVTVLSRCLQFQLKNLTRDEIAGYLSTMLTEENVSYDAAAVEVIARSAAGSMRDALSLTDQAIAYGQGELRGPDVTEMLGAVGRDEVGALLKAIAAGATAELLALSAELAERSADFREVMQGLLEAFHELSVAAALGQGSADYTAEELQLYYQIVLLGHRDLGIAPDERSGFEMTLLRLLAFAPESGSSVPPRSVPDGEAGPEVPETAPTSAEAAPSAPDAPSAEATPSGETAPSAAAPRAPADEARSQLWFETVSKLEVGGVTRMIAEHAVLEELALPTVRLLLDADHDTLLNEAQLKNLGRALEAVLGDRVQLTIDTGPLPSESPAGRRQREAAERQAAAEATIEADSTVQSLVNDFGGRVEQIRPI